jgi:hypothetical protein
MSRRFLACLALAAISLVTSSASAQTPPAAASAPTGYTFVAHWQIPRAQWGQFAADVDKNTRPVLEKLSADGTLVNWGIFEYIVHQPDAPTHGIWWSAGSYAAMEKARLELLPTAANSTALTQATGHSDFFFNTVAGNTKSASGSGYLSVSIQLTKPGKGREFLQLWEKNNKPILDDLVAKGTVSAYAVHAQDVHTGNPGLRWIVTIVPTAAADDQVGAAFDAVSEKLTPQERQTRELMMDNVIERTAHRDVYARIIRYWQK